MALEGLLLLLCVVAADAQTYTQIDTSGYWTGLGTLGCGGNGAALMSASRCFGIRSNGAGSQEVIHLSNQLVESLPLNALSMTPTCSTCQTTLFTLSPGSDTIDFAVSGSGFIFVLRTGSSPGVYVSARYGTTVTNLGMPDGYSYTRIIACRTCETPTVAVAFDATNGRIAVMRSSGTLMDVAYTTDFFTTGGDPYPCGGICDGATTYNVATPFDPESISISNEGTFFAAVNMAGQPLLFNLVTNVIVNPVGFGFPSGVKLLVTNDARMYVLRRWNGAGSVLSRFTSSDYSYSSGISSYGSYFQGAASSGAGVDAIIQNGNQFIIWVTPTQFLVTATWTSSTSTYQQTNLANAIHQITIVAHPFINSFFVSHNSTSLQMQAISGPAVTTTAPTAVPTATPTPAPTANPTVPPTRAPTASPTFQPTATPTRPPTAAPTPSPTAAPTFAPTPNPTAVPTRAPTATPTAAPSAQPTAQPSAQPTAQPTATPTPQPTAQPTAAPTRDPTATPTAVPTIAPGNPTPSPTTSPTPAPSAPPTAAPSAVPSTSPTPAPSAVPTTTPTAVPTASPTPAPAPVFAAQCARPNTFGVGTQFSTSTCDYSGTCTAPTAIGCVNGTVDYVNRTCSMYRRVYNETEINSTCGANRDTQWSNASCTKLCTMRTPSDCFDETCACPPPITHLPPTVACTTQCGPGVYSCVVTTLFNSTTTKASVCTCDPSTSVGIGSDIKVSDSTPNCVIQGTVTTACTSDEAYTFCGMEGALGCTMRTHWASGAVASAWDAYRDTSSSYAGHHPSELLQYFTPVTNSITGFTTYRLNTSAYGTAAVRIPECRCLVNASGAFDLKSPLPSPAQLAWPTARFNGTQRFRYGTCGFVKSFIDTTWRATRDYCPATRGGTCNGHGTCVPWGGVSACNNSVRESYYSTMTNFLSNTSAPFPTGLLWGATHFILDLWTEWDARPTNNTSQFATNCTQPFCGTGLPAVGCSESTTFLDAWRAVRNTTDINYWRYLRLPLSPYECRQSLTEQLCFAGSPVTSGCDVNYLNPFVDFTVGGVTWASLPNPVRTCERTFLHDRGTTGQSGGADGETRAHSVPAVVNTASLGVNVFRFATGDACSSLRGGSLYTTPCVCDVGYSGFACQKLSGVVSMQAPLDVSPGCGVNGQYVNGACSCNAGWYSLPYEPCSTQACPAGRFGSDCSAYRNVTGGYWMGNNGNVPVAVPACVHGTVSSSGLSIFCVCNEGWVGQACDISACPITNGQICNGKASCHLNPDGSGTHTCLWSATGTEIGQPSCNTPPPVCRFSNGTITTAGGCACQVPDRYVNCRQPSNPTLICDNIHANTNLYGSGQRCDRCASSIDAATGIETFRCSCPPFYSGTYCEIAPCKRIQSESQCSLHGTCSGNTCLCDGSPGGNLESSSGLFIGAYCEVDVAAQCGTTGPTGGLLVCAQRGVCVQTGGVWGCSCTDTRYTNASKCTVLSTDAPTPAPTGSPANAPTPPPTPAPTPANGTIVTTCNVSCSGGTCRQINGAPTCICPEPRVRALDPFTGDCVLNACPNGTLPNANNTACVCTDPTQVNDPPQFGPCRAPLTCASVNSHLCGVRSLLENTSVPIFDSTASKFCTDGVCTCHDMYVARNGTCTERCVPERTTGWNGSCICTPGFDSALDCAAISCSGVRRVNPLNPNECICQAVLGGSGCATILCKNGTFEPNYTCSCFDGMFSGVLCETVACQGTLVFNGSYSCRCPAGGGWGGSLCTTNLCLNGGTPDVNGYCACVTNATLNRALCNPSAGCAANSQSIGGVCTCNPSFTGVQCRERVCLNGGFFVNSTFCICASGWTGARCNVSTVGTPTVSPTPAPSTTPSAAPSPAPSTAPPTEAPTSAPISAASPTFSLSLVSVWLVLWCSWNQ